MHKAYRNRFLLGSLTILISAVFLLTLTTAVFAINPVDRPFFSQRDSSWSNDYMGISGCMIKDCGCAMVDTAMLLEYYGIETNPKELNLWLSNNNGYTGDGALYWSKPAEYSGVKMQYMESLSWTSSNIATDNDRWNDLNTQVTQGYPVIVKVDAYPSTPALDAHWVLVTFFAGGAVNNPSNYYINDPWDLSHNPDKTLSTYYDATYDNTFFATRVYHGTKFDLVDFVVTTSNTNVRLFPDTSANEISDPDYPGYAPTGTVGEVVGESSGADGYRWWEIDYGPGSYTGWSVQDWLEETDMPISSLTPTPTATATLPTPPSTPTATVITPAPTTTTPPTPTSTATWYVDDDLVEYPAADFTSIQDAVNASSSGDTITVYPGTYAENVNVNKSYLTIRSVAGAQSTIIKGQSISSCSWPPGPGVITICQTPWSGSVYGVSFIGFTVNTSEIQSSFMDNCIYAINLYKAFGCNISENIILGGISPVVGYPGSCDNHIVVGLQESCDNQIKNNVMQNASLLIMDGSYFDSETGAFIDRGCHRNIIEGNMVNAKPLVYLEGVSDQTITNAGQVVLVSCNNITVRDLDLASIHCGIELLETNNSTITSNTIDVSSGVPISLICSLNNNISDNTIYGKCATGIYLGSSSDNLIKQNKINIFTHVSTCEGGGNIYQGIKLLWDSNDNLIQDNIINVNCWVGIEIVYSSGNTIMGNTISSTDFATGIASCLSPCSINDNVLYNTDIYLGGCWQWPTPQPHTDELIVDGNKLSGGSIRVNIRDYQTQTITNNIFTNGGLILNPEDIYANYSSYNLVIENNTVNSKPLVYMKSAANQEITDAGQVILVACDNITVNGLDLNGVWLWATNNSLIANNRITQSPWNGIDLSESSRNKITSNTISNSRIYGVTIYGSSDNQITENLITDNDGGITIGGFPYMWWPWQEYYYSKRNTIAYNTISHNQMGISTGGKYGNSIYLNNFIQNTCSANNLAAGEFVNSSDEMSYTYSGNTYRNYLGNYWDDYIGSDTDGDGIGDTPYPIDQGADNYPLAKTFENYTLTSTHWSFAIITDLHIGRGFSNLGYEYKGEDYYLTKRLENAIDVIIGQKPRPVFVVILGDISEDGKEAEFLKTRDILEKLNNVNIPYIPIIGNHDAHDRGAFDNIMWSQNSKNIGLINDLFTNSWEKDPTILSEGPVQNYAFTYNGIQFVALDYATPNSKPDERDVTTNWLDTYINEDIHGILFCHHPLSDTVPWSLVNWLSQTMVFWPWDLNNIETKLRDKDQDVDVLAAFCGHVHIYDDIFLPSECWFPANFLNWNSIVTCPIYTTEALMVGQIEDVPLMWTPIRLVEVNTQAKPPVISNNKLVPMSQGALNPSFDCEISKFVYVNGIQTPLEYALSAKTFTKRQVGSYNWDFGPLGQRTGEVVTLTSDELSSSLGPGPTVQLPVNLTVTDKDYPTISESIAHNVEINLGNAWHLFTPTGIKALDLRTGQDLSVDIENRDGIPVLIMEEHSPAKPVAEVTVNFSQATDNISLTSLVAEVDFNQRKSFFHMPDWPEEVDQSKVLFIPSTGVGTIYICPNATSLSEVNAGNATLFMNVGETKEGMTVSPIIYEGQMYYMVEGVTGTGGGEVPAVHYGGGGSISTLFKEAPTQTPISTGEATEEAEPTPISTPEITPTPTPAAGLSGGALGGIGIGALIVIAFCGSGIWLLMRRKKVEHPSRNG